MDKFEELVKRAQLGDEEAEIALLAIFHEEIRALSELTDDPQTTFDTLRSEFLLEIRSGRITEWLNRQKRDTNEMK